MQHPHPPGQTTAAVPPATGGTSYYPAIPRGNFPSVRAALASIGCVGEAAELQIANAKAEASQWIAVPVKVTGAPADCGECVALVYRKPGGRAALHLGLIGLASDDRDEAYALAQAIADNGPANAEVSVFEWKRQRREALQ